jgi:hypothetical protein
LPRDFPPWRTVYNYFIRWRGVSIFGVESRSDAVV